MKKSRRCRRQRVGRVSYYQHHGGWYLYYQQDGQIVRKRVADTEEQAAQLAAQINAQLASGAPTLLTFEPISVPELRQHFLEHHELVLHSTLSTVRRYRAATQHLENFVLEMGQSPPVHEIRIDRFVRYLRTVKISPNGHPHSDRRLLRQKGLRYILEVCRSLFTFASKRRHLPPYAPNPFAEISLERMKVEDAKAIFVFEEQIEQAFFVNTGQKT